jgi:DNA-directed RNA polymerase subunit K
MTQNVYMPLEIRVSSHDEDVHVRYTRFEKARIIGARALQISMAAPVLIDIPPEVIDPIEIAMMEYGNGAIPITVKRGT